MYFPVTTFCEFKNLNCHSLIYATESALVYIGSFVIGRKNQYINGTNNDNAKRITSPRQIKMYSVFIKMHVCSIVLYL